MATWSFVRATTPPVDGVVDIHPPQILTSGGAGAGSRTYSGSFRSVRGTLTGAGTYTAAGGDALGTAVAASAGLSRVTAIIVVTDGVPVVVAGQLRYNTVTDKIQLYTLAAAELGAVSAVGSYDVILLGKG